MSGFSVIVDELVATAARLGSISGDLDGLRGRVGGHAGAGAGTPAEASVDAFVARLASSLPGFGLSADRLSAAVAAGGGAYSRAEVTVAAATDGGER